MKKTVKKARSSVRESYVMVSRLYLSKLFSEDEFEREAGKVLLTLTYHCYFSDRVVTVNRRVIECQRGEWVTSITQISRLTGIEWHTVKRHLELLEKEQILSLTKIPGVGYRIRFDAYLKFMEKSEKANELNLPEDVPDLPFGENLNFPSDNKLAFADGSYS